MSSFTFLDRTIMYKAGGRTLFLTHLYIKTYCGVCIIISAQKSISKSMHWYRILIN